MSDQVAFPEKQAGPAPEYNVDDYQHIAEGRATILFPKQNEVFYNPVQEFNRDMSIAAIKTWWDVRMDERKARPDKKEPQRRFTILEALAASGLRSVRYAREIPGVDHILANDLLADAVESIRRNAHHNGVSELVQANQGDAVSVMYAQRDKTRFGVVDLDPYGTAAPFVDAALQAVEKGGLLCVTCTDLAVLAGTNHPETCFGKYGGGPLKGDVCHELALRLVVHSLQQAANRHRRYIEPLLSCSIDFYVRIFVRVHDSPLKIKSVAAQTGLVYRCPKCTSFAIQPFGTQPGPHKYRVAPGPPVDRGCASCGSAQDVGGPCWIGPLHNPDFVQRMYNAVSAAPEEMYGTQARMRGMLKLIHEELPDTPFHYSLSELCSAVRTTCPPLTTFNSALLNAGYRVSGAHTCQGTIKTDAPPHVVWDIMRVLAGQNGRSPKIAADSPAARILDAEPPTKVSFELHKDANPESRRINLVRYQINPEKNWGPKARHTERKPAKRDGEEDAPCKRARTDQ
ncbi:RNA methyltransferase tRNA(m5U54)methyltransferase [Coemansia sp. RSA 552]|nr:RNA methyltransferase tRNA(m5U54)methyltransferase [Coemansia sp. RSA 552]